MTKALQVVQAVYERFAAGDLAGFLDLCAEDIEWVVNGPAHLAKCRDFHGRAGVQGFLDILGSTWSFNAFTPREFIAHDNKVVVLGEETGKDQDSGIGFENRWAHVFQVQDGKVTCFREFLCHWSGSQKPPAMSWSPGES